MPIQIITNFDVNSSSPIDSRMVVSNTTERDNILYKYHGLKVFQTNTNTTWTWIGSTWSMESNGIYGGSGSLIGNTEVSLGNLNSTESSVTNIFSLSNSNGRLDQYFLRNRDGNQFNTSLYSIEYNSQSGFGPYIRLNRRDGNNLIGGISLGVGFGPTSSLIETLVLRGDGRIGFNSEPTTNLQIGSSNSVYAPFTINTGTTFSSIGFNFRDYLGNRNSFDSSREQAEIFLSNNNEFLIRFSEKNGTLLNRISIGQIITNISSGGSGTSGRIDLQSPIIDITGKVRVNNSLGLTNPAYSFSGRDGIGMYSTDARDLSFAVNNKRIHSMGLTNSQISRYTDTILGNPSSYIIEGSRAVRGSINGTPTDWSEHEIANVQIPENLTSHNESPSIEGSFQTQLRNGKLVIIEASLIGRITKSGSNGFRDNLFGLYQFRNIYNITNTRSISVLSSTFSVIRDNTVGFGFSASIIPTNPNNFKFSYYFRQEFGLPQTAPNTILSAMVDYKITVMNDYAGDYHVVTGFLIPNQLVLD